MTNSLPFFPDYRGRFAPSPTGPLHFGSLVAAVGSYIEAKSRQGEWIVRIENLDPAREINGASKEILDTLQALGMEWDGEIVYQKQRYETYQAAFAVLERQGFLYPCVCSRKEIADSTTVTGIDGPVYPDTCRGRFVDDQSLGAWRIRTDNRVIEFEDWLQGRILHRMHSDIGDFVLRRADGVFAYQLAAVVDDAEQGVTHVVRGRDLLNSTSRQIYLQQLLGYPTPFYLHLPVVVNLQGEKLSKQTCATPLDVSDPMPQLMMAIRFLGQVPPSELVRSNVSSFWKWAIENWKPEKIRQK